MTEITKNFTNIHASYYSVYQQYSMELVIKIIFIKKKKKTNKNKKKNITTYVWNYSNLTVGKNQIREISIVYIY